MQAQSRGKSFLAPNILPLFRAGKSGNVGARQSMIPYATTRTGSTIRMSWHGTYSQNMHMKRDLITSSRYVCTVVGKQTGSREKEKSAFPICWFLGQLDLHLYFLCVTSNIYLLNLYQMNWFLHGKFIWFSIFDIQFSDLTFLGT